MGGLDGKACVITRALPRPRRRLSSCSPRFLASDESTFVNGAAFVVNDGLTAADVRPQ